MANVTSNDAEWNWCAPKQAIIDIGGMDEQPDFGYGGDQLQAALNEWMLVDGSSILIKQRILYSPSQSRRLWGESGMG